MKPGFHSNAIMVATASTEHSYWLALAFVAYRNGEWRIGMLNRTASAVATMIGFLPTQALAFLAVFVYATHAT